MRGGARVMNQKISRNSWRNWEMRGTQTAGSRPANAWISAFQHPGSGCWEATHLGDWGHPGRWYICYFSPSRLMPSASHRWNDKSLETMNVCWMRTCMHGDAILNEWTTYRLLSPGILPLSSAAQVTPYWRTKEGREGSKSRRRNPPATTCSSRNSPQAAVSRSWPDLLRWEHFTWEGWNMIIYCYYLLLELRTYSCLEIV